MPGATCPHCGATVQENDNFCVNCGGSLTIGTTQTPSAPNPDQPCATAPAPADATAPTPAGRTDTAVRAGSASAATMNDAGGAQAAPSNTQPVGAVRDVQAIPVTAPAPASTPTAYAPVTYAPASPTYPPYANAAPKKKKGTGKIIAIACIAVVAVLALIVSQQMEKQSKADSYASYVSTLESAQSEMLDGASTAEDVAIMAVDVWHSAIWDDSRSEWDADIQQYYSSDFNTAIQKMYDDPVIISKLSTIRSSQSDVKDMMSRLQNPPEGLSEAYATTKELYGAYTKITDLALSPTGSLSTYSDEVRDAQDDFMTAYNTLDTQIPDSSKKKTV